MLEHGGLCFIILKINNLIYLIKGEDIISFITNETRKSIPYQYILDKGFNIKENFYPPIDYLSVVDQVYLKGD